MFTPTPAPAPWTQELNQITDAAGNLVATIAYTNDSHVQANARLVTAAPALLDALQGITAHAQYMVNMHRLQQEFMPLDFDELQKLIDAARTALQATAEKE